MDFNKICMWLLFISGAVLFMPAIYDWLTDLTEGTPWIQIFLGLLSVIIAVVMFIKSQKK